MEGILGGDGRFKDVAAEMETYRETVFSRGIPFTMMEARAILSKFRKWQNVIDRRLETEEWNDIEVGLADFKSQWDFKNMYLHS